MSSPSPNGPTINDLQYQSFSPNLPFAFNPGVYDQTVTSENVSVNLPGYTLSFEVTDVVNHNSITLAVNINLPGPNQFSIAVSDSTQTSELNTNDFVGYSFNISVSDTTVTSENVVA